MVPTTRNLTAPPTPTKTHSVNNSKIHSANNSKIHSISKHAVSKIDYHQTIADLMTELSSKLPKQLYRAPVIKTLVINKSDQHTCLNISNTVNILTITMVCCGSWLNRHQTILHTFLNFFLNVTLSGVPHLYKQLPKGQYVSDLRKTCNLEANLWKMWPIFSNGSG